jgi:hypothetical protein
VLLVVIIWFTPTVYPPSCILCNSDLPTIFVVQDVRCHESQNHFRLTPEQAESRAREIDRPRAVVWGQGFGRRLYRAVRPPRASMADPSRIQRPRISLPVCRLQPTRFARSPPVSSDSTGAHNKTSTSLSHWLVAHPSP